MATVTTPPPQRDDLEALIEEARRRQRRRQHRIAAGLLVAGAAAGVAAYLVVAGTGEKTRPSSTDRSPATAVPPRGPEIVFAADRRSVAYGEIYRVGLDGRSVDLSRSPAVDTTPAVSPDGRWVAFLSDRSGHAALYVTGIDGHGLRRLSPNLGSLDGQIVQPPGHRFGGPHLDGRSRRARHALPS